MTQHTPGPWIAEKQNKDQFLTMIGEKATTDITKEKDSQGLEECRDSANIGGNIAKRTREDIETNIGKSIISKENFLPKNKEEKRLK